MSRSEVLAEKLRTEGEKTAAFFSRLPEGAWPVKLYADGARWSVQEVLAHIVETEGALLTLFRFIAAGGSGVANYFDIDRYNAKAVAKLVDWSAAELQAEFAARRQTMIAFAAGLSDAELDNLGRHPYLGEASLAEMLRLFYLHVNLHIRDIRKVLE